MRGLRDASVKHKLLAIPMLTTTVAMAVAGVLYLTFDVLSVRRELQRELASLAAIVGANSSAAVLFEDEASAAEILASLAARPNIVGAKLLTRQNQLLAEYTRGGSAPAARGLIEQSSPIVVKGQTLGSITIYSDLGELRDRIRRAATIGALVVAASLLVGFILASRLQQLIWGPLVHLAETVGRISENKDYSVRAAALSGDELGALTVAFNGMLEQIQSRDAALTGMSKNLEQLYRLSTTIQEPLSLGEHLTQVLESARQVVAVDRLALWVLSSDLTALTMLAGAGYSGDEWEGLRGVRLPASPQGAVHDLFREGIATLFDDHHPKPPVFNPLFRDAGQKPGRCLLVVPMIARGRPLGMLTADNVRSCEAIRRDTADLLQIFASHAAVAVENARLFQELEDKGRQLWVASRHKTQFLANMSHELRTPLNAIIGYTELIRDNIYGEVPPKIQEILERVDFSSRHLLALINQVLDVSKIEAGHLTLGVNSYSMRDVVRIAVSSLEALAAEKGLALRALVPSNLPDGVGDERRIMQVLLNLVGNAIKFTDQGEVVVETAAVDGMFAVSIRDTGPGISEADQRRIFEEFQQGDSSSTKKKAGTGLGLSIAKKIIELHGGSISVESTPGRGSTFRFTIPLSAPSERLSA